MKTRPLAIPLMSALSLIFIAGCSNSKPAATSEAAAHNVRLDYKMDMAAAPNGRADDEQGENRAEATFQGKLHCTNLATKLVTTFDWYAQIDEAAFTARSNKAIPLPAGNYDFVLDLANGDHRYRGESLGVAIKDRLQITIPTKLRPVIGQTKATTGLTQCAGLMFKYPVEEFKGLTHPILGVKMGTLAEQRFLIDKATGSSTIFMDTTPGSHTIHLALYDGDRMVGRSVQAQESKIIVLGQSLVMDIIALSGEAAFDLPIEGGTATLNFSIPNELLDEVGGHDKLDATLQIHSKKNGFRELKLDFRPSESRNHIATAALTNYHFDKIDCITLFKDRKNSNIVGYGSVNNLILTKDPKNATMFLMLRRRAMASGNLLATIGVNALQKNAPVKGAKIYANGNLVGITGSGTFGAEGYCEILLKQGTHELEASKDNLAGTAKITVSPLQVNDIDIPMAAKP